MNRSLMAVLALLGGATAGVAAWNTWLSWQAGPLESALPGRTRFYHWLRSGEIVNVFYRVSESDGPPIVLVHGIDAAASSGEFRRVFAGLSEGHRVYALDLVGFGLSDRPGWAYAPTLYLDLLDDFLCDVVEQPAAIVASSLAGAYAIAVAARSPARVASLLLTCPTGLQRFADSPNRWQRAAGQLLRLPIVGSTLFNLIVSRRVLRYFLAERTYAEPALVTPDVIDAYYRASHQVNARFAPAAFVGGALNLSIRDVYPMLAQPVFIVWGRGAQITPVSDANQFIRLRPSTRLKVLDRCGLLPHDERSEEFLAIAQRVMSNE